MLSRARPRGARRDPQLTVSQAAEKSHYWSQHQTRGGISIRTSRRAAGGQADMPPAPPRHKGRRGRFHFGSRLIPINLTTEPFRVPARFLTATCEQGLVLGINLQAARRCARDRWGNASRLPSGSLRGQRIHAPRKGETWGPKVTCGEPRPDGVSRVYIRSHCATLDESQLGFVRRPGELLVVVRPERQQGTGGCDQITHAADRPRSITTIRNLMTTTLRGCRPWLCEKAEARAWDTRFGRP